MKLNSVPVRHVYYSVTNMAAIQSSHFCPATKRLMKQRSNSRSISLCIASLLRQLIHPKEAVVHVRTSECEIIVNPTVIRSIDHVTKRSEGSSHDSWYKRQPAEITALDQST
jgi:hypothetical protein